MTALLAEFWRSAWRVALIGLFFWIILMSYRSRYDLDLPMTRRGQLIRFALLAICWISASISFATTPGVVVVRWIAILVGLTILCWPNILVHAMGAIGYPIDAPEAPPDEFA